MTRGRQSSFSLIANSGKDGYTSFRIGVPVDVGKACLEAGITSLEVSLTDEGILYRPVRDVDLKPPQWLKGKKNGRTAVVVDPAKRNIPSADR